VEALKVERKIAKQDWWRLRRRQKRNRDSAVIEEEEEDGELSNLSSPKLKRSV
jgi:hypothetical protein